MQEIITSQYYSTEEVHLEFFSEGIFVETVFYKNSKNAHWFILLFLAGLMFFFYGLRVFDDYVFPVMVLCLLFAVPVYAVISNKSWFSFAALDERKLRIDGKGIQVGEEYFLFAEISKLKVFLDSFYHQIAGFHHTTPGAAPQGILRKLLDGNKNELHFTYGQKKYYYRFILRNKEAYIALRTIIQFWITVNDEFSAIEKFPIEHINFYN